METPDPAAALDMLAAFASVGATHFDLTLTDLAGEKTGFQPNRSVDELRRSIGSRLEAADRAQKNFIVRPRPIGGVTLIQLDDLDATKAARVSAHSFLILETSPANFQAWVAVKDAPQDFGRRLRKGTGADPTASGAVRISGSRNFKAKYAPAFPVVRITQSQAGNLAMAAALEQAGLVAALEETPPRVSNRASRPSGDRRRWPSYARCLRNAPPVHQGDRPDISKADFVWCMTAIDWGWSIEDTAARLLQESSKARENGEKYALITAQNAALAVQRRQRPSNAPSGPR